MIISSLNLKKKIAFVISTSLISVSCLLGCGGGGGGSGFLGAARVSISVSPNRIDTGDRVAVDIDLSEIHENGIAVKILFPTGLEYVTDSAFLTVRNVDIDIGPTNNEVTDEGVYLVFFLSQAIFGKDLKGVLRFELEGVDEVIDGRIGVDPDVDDPRESNSVEFDTSNPEYLAEDEVFIEVVS